MKTSFLGIAAVATFTIAGTASAQETTTQVAPQPAQTVAVAPQETETVTQKGGPSRLMLESGLVIFGASYGTGVIVAATSNRDADHNMFIPVAGPWMALFDRGDCGGITGRSCNTETTYKVLIIVDGVFQAIGVIDVLGAFLNPETVTTTKRTASRKIFDPHVMFAPTSVGKDGYGLGAIGAF